MSRLDDDLDAILDSIGPADGPDAIDLDPRWEALSLGELDEADAAALRREAGVTERGRELLALFDPLADAAVIEATAARVVGLRGEPVAPLADATPWTVPASDAPVAEAVVPQGPGLLARVLAFFRQPVVVGALVAAVAVVAVLPRGGDTTLPTYDIELRTGDRAVRSEGPAAEGVARMSAGSTLEVLLRPQQGAGPSDAEAVATVVVGASRQPMTVAVEASDDGVLLVRGRLPDPLAALGDGAVEITLEAGGARRVVKVPVVLTDAGR